MNQRTSFQTNAAFGMKAYPVITPSINWLFLSFTKQRAGPIIQNTFDCFQIRQKVKYQEKPMIWKSFYKRLQPMW